jgi:hypothetical protein
MREFHGRMGWAFLRRFVVIAATILCVVALTICTPAPVCGAEDAIIHMLPAPGFAPDWVLKEQINLYSSDTLFDHIDGEAELYFPYGFDRLATATYANRKNPEVWAVVDVYRMGSSLDAFGIYSNYRKSGATAAQIGAEGFVSPSQLMFYQGRYFVRIQVTGAKSLGQDLLVACGRAVSRNLPAGEGRPREVEALAGVPGVVSRSERYLGKSLLGYDFFRRGVTADAMLKGERVQVFAVLENSTDAARKAFDEYCSHLSAEGRKPALTGTGDRMSLIAADPLYQGVFVEQSGPYVIGAIRMKEASAGKMLVEALHDRLVRR